MRIWESPEIKVWLQNTPGAWFLLVKVFRRRRTLLERLNHFRTPSLWSQRMALLFKGLKIGGSSKIIFWNKFGCEAWARIQRLPPNEWLIPNALPFAGAAWLMTSSTIGSMVPPRDAKSAPRILMASGFHVSRVLRKCP